MSDYKPTPNCSTKGCGNTVPLHVVSYYRAPHIRPTCHPCTITKLMNAEDEIERLTGWLILIDGGDHPMSDPALLRRFAFRALRGDTADG